MKTKLSIFLGGLFLGLVVIGGIFAFAQRPNKIIPETKMTECLKSGGEYSILDWSLRDDGSDYRMTCEIPKHRLWQIRF